MGLKLKGKYHSGASANILVGNDLIRQIQGIDFGQKLSREMVTALGARDPIGFTDGTVNPEMCSVELPTAAYDYWIHSLAKKNSNGSYTDEEFTINVHLHNRVDPLYKVEILHCLISGEKDAIKPGSKLLTTKVDVMFLKMMRGGLSMTGGGKPFNSSNAFSVSVSF